MPGVGGRQEFMELVFIKTLADILLLDMEDGDEIAAEIGTASETIE
jgi:hypothetical protein